MHLVCRRGRGTESFALPGTEARYAPDVPLLPVHMEIRLDFDLEGCAVEGEVTLRVVGRRPARVLRLDAVDLSAVRAEDPAGRRCSLQSEPAALKVVWEEPFAAGEERQVTLRYRVERPLTGMIFSRAAHGERLGPPWVATDHETERARYWLPCVDHPSVRTSLDLVLTAPEECTILANGVLVDETCREGRKTAHWRLEQPCPSYLICLAIGEFVRFDGGEWAGVPVAAYALHGHRPETLGRSFGVTREQMEWLTAKLGAPFPYPKYYQVALPGIGGAMENISLTTWDDAFLLDETLAAEWQRVVERVNVHEMAHSYFGDAIVISDFAHAWLKEGWATYVEALWVEDRYGADEFHYHLQCEAEDYMREADERYARPIVTRRYSSSWEMFDQHLYPGGGWRLHMLRWRVGEEAFWKGVRRYVAEFSGRLVETADFRKALEEASGLDLARFFDEWVYAPGYPRLELTFEYDAEKRIGRLVLVQAQAKGDGPVGLFSFDLEIAFETSPGTWRRVTVPVEERRHVREVALEEPPLQVAVDPEQKVLFALDFDPGRERLERSLRSGPLTARLHAAKTLAAQGRRAGVRVLEEAWGEDPFWGVKVAIAKGLGKARTQAAAEALARLLEAETDPRVLAPLARACGEYRDAGVGEALAAFLADEERPYYHARAAAYEALGKQRDSAWLPLLRRGAEDRSWWGWVRRGALLGLGELRSAEAWEELWDRLPREGARQVRAQALIALARASSWQERGLRERALERLADVARAADAVERMQAARALVALGEPGAAGVLDAIAEQVPTQERPRVLRMAAKVRAAPPLARAAKLEKRVEELEAKVRALGERLEELAGGSFRATKQAGA